MTSSIAFTCAAILALQGVSEAKITVDAGTTTANTFQSEYFHFTYQFPIGWFVLPDAERVEENRRRYDITDKMSVPREPGVGVMTKVVATPYDLLIASSHAVGSSYTRQMPRINVVAIRRTEMMNNAEDPARFISLRMGSEVKKLKGPEKVLIGGRKFVRTDFEATGEYLSIFATEIGDHILEWDLRAANEKEFLELIDSMQTLQFSKH